MSVLFRNARVLTMDPAAREIARTDVLVEGPLIAAMGPDLVPPDQDTRIIDATGHLLMPGLINGHLHSPGNLMKGAVVDQPLELFMLYEVPPLMTVPESARLYYLRTLLGAVEMLKIGVTAVHDDAFFIPVPTRETVAAVMTAYSNAGMRATVTLDQPNVVEYEKYPFLEDILPPHVRAAMRRAPLQSDAELLTAYRNFIADWNGAAGGRLRCAVSCSAPQRVTPTYLEALTDLARQHDLPFDIHILETRLQRVLGQVKYGGRSLIRYVHDLGCLDERKMVIHAVWIDQDDIALMANAGCTIAHNPISNLKIGSGVMPFRPLREAGIPICLGSDEASTDDTLNMWNVAKTAGLIHKITDPDWRRWPTAPEILDCLITGGARSLRLSDRIGRIAPGYEADLILDRPRHHPLHPPQRPRAPARLLRDRHLRRPDHGPGADRGRAWEGADGGRGEAQGGGAGGDGGVQRGAGGLARERGGVGAVLPGDVRADAGGAGADAAVGAAVWVKERSADHPSHACAVRWQAGMPPGRTHASVFPLASHG